MERHRAHLEGKTGQQEHHAEQFALTHAITQRDGDAIKARAAGKAVKQRRAIKQDAARQRTEHEIFKARLGRPLVLTHEARQHIGGQALHLQPDI